MLEIYDCTLREGEQAAGAFFDTENRVKLFQVLDEFGIEYIEVGWPLNQEVIKAFELCRKIRKKAKIVAFGSTSIAKEVEKDENLAGIIESRADYACIFGKSSKEQVEKQLGISLEDNLKKISDSVDFLRKNGMKAFYDAEHYFDAFKEDKDYALETLIAAIKAGGERIILCDTNGGILPEEAEKIVKETKEELERKGLFVGLGVHFHDDSGLALANTLACLPYVVQVQGTINGIGERIGNLNFTEFLPVYMKKLNNKLEIDLKNLKEVNEKAYFLEGIEIPEIRRYVGETAFLHKGGIHIDASNKGASYEHLNPEEVGNRRIILLNSLGGKSCVVNVAENFGYKLDKKDEQVKNKISELFLELRSMEKKGYKIGDLVAEQYLLIEKYFGNLKEFFKIEKWDVRSRKENGREISEFFARCRINNEVVEDRLEVEGGPVDAAYKTLTHILGKKYPEILKLKLVDFHVGIARRKWGEGEESSVRTLITFFDDEEFQAVGVDSNIIQSAIEAIEKGFRYELNKKKLNY